MLVTKKINLFYCKLIIATRTETYATCHVKGFLCEQNLEGNSFASKLLSHSNVEDLSNMTGASCNMYKKDKSGERYIEKPRFVNGIRYDARDNHISWRWNTDACRREVRA